MVFHSLNTGKARLTARFHPCLDNERPSLAIYIGIRHIGCRIFTMYTDAYDIACGHGCSFCSNRRHAAGKLLVVNIRHPMRRIPIYIASDGLSLSKHGLRRAVILYNMIAKKKSNFESTDVYRKKSKTYHQKETPCI